MLHRYTKSFEKGLKHLAIIGFEFRVRSLAPYEKVNKEDFFIINGWDAQTLADVYTDEMIVSKLI